MYNIYNTLYCYINGIPLIDLKPHELINKNNLHSFLCNDLR